MIPLPDAIMTELDLAMLERGERLRAHLGTAKTDAARAHWQQRLDRWAQARSYLFSLGAK